jgi:hypothetical protein
MQEKREAKKKAVLDGANPDPAAKTETPAMDPLLPANAEPPALALERVGNSQPESSDSESDKEAPQRKKQKRRHGR